MVTLALCGVTVGCAGVQKVQRGPASERAVKIEASAPGWSISSFLSRKVAPYQKQFLSKPGMALVESPEEQASMNHMFNAREGSMGGFGGAGGGCGCN
jgi:hypothetical protein